MKTQEFVGERLQFLRNKKNISQKEMAEILKYSQRAISYWESGKREIPYDALLQICKYFSVEPNFFFVLDEQRITNHKSDSEKKVEEATEKLDVRLSKIEKALAKYGIVKIENNHGQAIGKVSRNKVKIGKE